MALSHHRKKEPDALRKKILGSAVRIAAEGKPGSLTIQAVAETAGVTKGGLLHHFPNKEALAEAVFEYLVENLDAEIDALMVEDPVEHGRFTRAYVRAIFRIDVPEASSPWTAMSITLLTDDRLNSLWAKWLNERKLRHKNTDNDISLEVVRYAADGVWLQDLTYPASTHPDIFINSLVSREDLFIRLIAMTRKDSQL